MHLLSLLRAKIIKMAPHADLAPTVEMPVTEDLRIRPLREQVSGLFEDNIAAKIINAAVNGLVDNVRPPLVVQ